MLLGRHSVRGGRSASCDLASQGSSLYSSGNSMPSARANFRGRSHHAGPCLPRLGPLGCFGHQPLNSVRASHVDVPQHLQYSLMSSSFCKVPVLYNIAWWCHVQAFVLSSAKIGLRILPSPPMTTVVEVQALNHKTICSP